MPNNDVCTSYNLITIIGASLIPVTQVEIAITPQFIDYQICSIYSTDSKAIQCYLPIGNANGLINGCMSEF